MSLHWRGRKVLAVCEHGNSRSVALAYKLKRRRADALACGVAKASPSTLDMLCTWADTIIVVDKTLAHRLPASAASKVLIWDVGPDVYFKGFKRELLRQYDTYFAEAK